MSVVDATYEPLIAGGLDWYYVLIRDLRVGEVWRVRKPKARGWHGKCYNASASPIGPSPKKEELGQLIIAAWEKFPYADHKKGTPR